MDNPEVHEDAQLSREEKLRLVGLSRQSAPSDKWRELAARKPRRAPRYLREDFPKVSMGGTVTLSSSGVPRIVGAGSASSRPPRTKRRRLQKKLKKKKATVGRRGKKSKPPVALAPAKIPTPPELEKLLRQKLLVRAERFHQVSSAPSETLQQLFHVPEPPRIPRPQNLGPRGGGASFLKERGLTASRINDRLMELQPAKAAAAFLDAVEDREAGARREQRQRRVEMQAAGRDRVSQNAQNVVAKTPGSSYREVEAARRQAVMAELRAMQDRARQRKSALDQAHAERIAGLATRHTSEAERSAARAEQQQAARAVVCMVVQALCGAELASLSRGLSQRRRLREAAVRIQQSVRMWGASRRLQECLAAKATIVRFFRSVVTFRRKRKEYWYAHNILQFLIDNRVNFRQIMRDFRFRVIKCQRFARVFLACTQARVAALSRLWVQQERRLAAKARGLRLQLLEKHSRKLTEEARAMQVAFGGEHASVKWLRQISVPERLSATGEIETMDGALRFPVGLGLRSGREAASARIEQQYREQVSRNANLILDAFLNEEYHSRLAREKEQPLTLRPVPREERYEVLREVISRARAAHQVRMAKLQRQRKVLETQKVKVDISEAKRLLSEQGSVVNVTKTLFSELGRQPVVLLFSQLHEREIFRLVQKSHVRLAETSALQQLIGQLRYE